MLPFIVTGLVTGSVYGLAAVGLVLTYKTSGIFNFAQGALATVAAYAFYELFVQSGWNGPLAAIATVLVVGPTMGLLLERLARALDGSSLALRVAATVGLLLAIQAVLTLHYGQLQTRIVPSFLGAGRVNLLGTVVTVSQLITFGFALVVTTGLYAFFRLARLGVAMRALVDNADLLDLSGTSSVAVRRWAWIIGCSFAAASGVLFAPLLPLDPLQLTLLVFPAFGAAAIGGFASLPLTFIGGLTIGVLASLSTKWFTSGILLGLPSALPFVVLFVVLLVFPKSRVGAAAPVVPRPKAPWTVPLPLQLLLGAATLVFLLFVPSFAGVHIGDWTTAVATAILFLSLGILVRTSGQVSLGHTAFLAIGAAAFCHLSNDALALPWPLAVLGAGLIAIPIGALLAIPAIRLSGLYLALATFGFAVLLSYMFYSSGLMFGSSGAGIEAPRPGFGEGDTAFYYVTLAFLAAATALAVALIRSRLGRLLAGLADSPTALSTSGVSVQVTRVLVFCLSAFLAAIAGSLMAMGDHTVSIETFPPFVSLTYLALIMIVFGREPWYALMAAAGLVLIPAYVSSGDTEQWLQLIFGAAAMAIAVAPAVLARFGRGTGRKIAVPPPGAAATAGREAAKPAPRPAARRVVGGGLEIENLRVTFGGLVAVDDVSLSAKAGAITGLIGPNGAGKTTTFNAASGLNRPDGGTVRLGDADVSRSGAARRARSGLGRTFQTTELFDSLPVARNVAIGAEGPLAGSNPFSQFVSRPGDGQRVSAETEAALQRCGIVSLATADTSVLSTGQRRLVELARCLAGSHRMLLLDEPSSGLDRVETRELGQILRTSVEETGMGALLVEHDMEFVMEVCDYVYVLDFGRLIFAGTPAEVRESPIVRTAYLGEEDPVPADPGTAEGEG